MTQLKYKNAIASILKCETEKIFLYWKGRIALYAILKSLGLQKDDEIIIPAFTCVVVPNAIFYAGLKPVYVDISTETYNMDIHQLEAAINSKTKVIICQNTFGLSSNISEVITLAKKYNLFTIEDCTHGFGGYYNGKPNGSYCDAAFYSTQWNKPFSTGIGGILVVNNKLFVKQVLALEKDKINPTPVEKIVLLSLIIFRQLIVNRYTQALLVKLYRFLSNYNLVVGSNQGSELNSTKMPKNYFKGISEVQNFMGVRKLNKIQKLNTLRKKNAKEYTAFLKKHNKSYVSEHLDENHLYLKYPLIVRNREKFFELAFRNKIMVGDWFLSPLHPVIGNLEKWGFVSECFPNATEISKKIVNLPTEIKNNSTVLKFLKENLELVK